MRTLLVTAFSLLCAAPALAQHDHAASGGGSLAEGWHAWPDRAAEPVAGVSLMSHGEGLHVKTGPAAIFWHEGSTAAGNFTAEATFTAKQQPPREAYGLVIGGRDLAEEGVDYAYFIIRGDGSFMIRHRAGTEVHTITPWTKHEAVRVPDAEGVVSNTLSIDAGAEQIRFLVNDTEVASFERGGALGVDGIVGLRVNHNLELQVDGLRVTPK